MLTLGALDVVYGEVGTSPIYAIREFDGLSPTPANVLGVLPLIAWPLIILIFSKHPQ